MKWLLLVLVLLALAFWLGARWSAGRASGPVAFRPVTDLPPPIVASIDRDLAAGLLIRAVKTYRDATECSLREAKAAIDVHRRNGLR